MATPLEQSETNAEGNETSAAVTIANGATDVHAASELRSFSSTEQLTVVNKFLPVIRRRIIQLDNFDESYITTTTLESFLELITKERLTRVPHRGSRWDRVLKCAEYFALQISAYADSLEMFAPGSRTGCQMALAQCRLLLEFGPNQATALETAFTVFYKLALSISFFLRNASLFRVDGYIRQELGHAFNDILNLVANVTVHYHDEIHSMTSHFTTLAFNEIFGTAIDCFYRRKTHIADAMWSYSLRNSRSGFDVDVQTIRRWLRPADRTLRLLRSDQYASESAPAEYTCEWSQSHVSDFLRSRDDILAITGPEGCGKSVLAGWIERRLQRPLRRRSYETVSYAFEAEIPSSASSLAFIKSLTRQLLERSVGDVDFYSQLIKCYDISTNAKEVHELESALWRALKEGLDNIAKSDINLVIIVDGLHEISGPDGAALKVFDRIQQLTNKYSSVQAIVLSRPFSWPAAKGLRKLSITQDHTHDDIRHVVQTELEDIKIPESDRESAINKLVDAADGSFLWTVLTLQSVKSEAPQQILKAVEQADKDLDKAIAKFVAKSDFKSQDCKRILGWMLVAERPLTLQELQHLLQVDLQQHTFTRKDLDIQATIKKSCGSIVVVRQGIVRFRHGAVRQHILKMTGKGGALMAVKEAQRDLVTRMLACVKLYLTRPYEPTFEPLDYSVLEDLFGSYQVLEYAVRYWTSHFRQSSMYKEGEFEVSSEFKAIFPPSSFLSMIEWACWGTQTSTWDAKRLHDLALSVRQEVLGHNHKAVLQSRIVVGNICRRLSLLSEASFYFYEASRIAQAILPSYSAVTITCITTFLACTEHMEVTTRTDVVTRREELLKLIITIYKYQHGETSDIVIRYYKILANLYIQIHEDHHATVIYRELHRIIIMRFGLASNEAKEISQKMLIVLKKDSKQEDIVEYAESIFEVTEETMEIGDIIRITMTIQLAEFYELRGDLFMAEQILVNLWRKITEICRIRHAVEIHVAKIDIALAYARFLKRCGRREEASSIMICIWTEYEHEAHGSEEIIIRLRMIGELMRSVGLLRIAISVFTSVWNWFKKIGKTTDEEAETVTVLISETVEEEITTVTKTSTSVSTTTTITVSETIIREIFETTIKRTISSKVHVDLFKICNALVTIYIEQKKWSEAVHIIERSLEIVWKAVITGEGTVSLPGEFVSETILIVLRLAACYRHNSFERAEQIHIRVFRACLQSLHVQDERVYRAAYALIKFYEEHHRHEKEIEVYMELLEKYRTVLGVTHALTIKTLYSLGSLCVLYGRVEAYSYYLEIVVSLNKDSQVCHHDAFQAAIILSKWYYEQKRWVEVQQFCKILWETIVHRHTEYSLTEEIVEVLYEMYSHALRFHAKAEYSILYKLTVEYRQTCTKVWGVSAEITIKALLQLARICETVEEHYEEAVTIYEEIIKVRKTITATTTTTTTTTTTVDTTVKRRLTKVYVKIITSGSSRSTSITIKRAITLCKEVLEELKIQFGCAHEKTLLKIKDLVILYKKLEEADYRSIIIRLLQTTIIEIITKETSTVTLYAAAATLASIYVSCEIVSEGFDLLRELKRQVIIHGFGSAHNFDIKIDHHHIGRVAYVFFVCFEQTLRGSIMVSHAELMADLLTESVLYEQYIRVTKSQTNIELILLHGARLRSFLVVRKREQEVKMLETQTFDFFLKKWGSSVQTQRQTTFTFFIALLEELGKDRRDTNMVNIVNIVCAAINNKIEALLKQGKFQEAYEIGLCGYQFISYHKAYDGVRNIAHGFKLSVLMAGRGVNKSSDAKLRDSMLKLSQDVIGEVFRACRRLSINFVQIKLDELNSLIGLLGEQRNFANLEWLLEQLWNSREAQKNWSSDTIIAIGRRLIESRASHGHYDSAIRLCEAICYNRRRANGSLHPETLDMYNLLSQLYTSAGGRYRKAMGVHEEILRLIAFGDEEDDRSRDMSHEFLASTAKAQLKLLKVAYRRLGDWDKSPEVYYEIYDKLVKLFTEDLEVPPIRKWSSKSSSKDDGLGKFAPPASWELFLPGKKEPSRPDIVRLASQTWRVQRGFHGCGQTSFKKGVPVPVLSGKTVSTSTTTTTTTTTSTSSGDGDGEGKGKGKAPPLEAEIVY